MYWELIILAISFIILAFDIAWQFYVAGMYAPKKAHRLIIEDPLIQKLDQKLEVFETKLQLIENILKTQFSRSGAAVDQFTSKNQDLKVELKSDLQNLKGDITNMLYNELENKFVTIKEALQKSIAGSIGHYVKMEKAAAPAFLEGMDLEQVGELAQMTPQQIEHENGFQLLSRIFDEQTADNLAATYAYCSPIIKKPMTRWIKKQIKERLG